MKNNAAERGCACGHDQEKTCGQGEEANGKSPLLVPAHITSKLYIEQMDCPTEEGLIRKAFAHKSEVSALDFNLIQRILTVTHEAESLPLIMQTIEELGMKAQLFLDQAEPQTSQVAAPQKSLRLLVLAGFAAIGAEIAEWMSGPEYIAAGLALLAVMICGLGTYRKGWISVRQGSLNINALMSIAVTGALILRQWPEAAMVMVLFTLAEWLEAKSLDRARNAIRSLVQLVPELATVRQQDGSWLEIPVRQVQIGEVVRVKPGERIALDGEIVAGQSTVDQGPITGESLPVDKSVGDQVYAGTINQSGSFEFKVSAAAAQSTLARIIRVVEDAQSARSPTQRFVDRFARIYTPAVLILSIAVAVIPPLVLGGGWYEWVYRALVLLVIACPCALVISTPVTIVSGLTAAARHGILIKGGVYLEEGHKLSWLALDKTGTITHGKPALTDTLSLLALDGIDANLIAVSLAARSDHPVSQAIARTALSHLPVNEFAAILGRGVSGTVNGVTYQLGNHRLMHESGVCSPGLEAQINALEKQGKTVIMLANAEQVLMLYAVADTVKDSSRAAIEALHQLKVKTVMLTGDNAHTAAAIATQVNINEARGNQLPEDKLRAIEHYAQQGKVGMVGDGINDAPALARADIGFAMGAMGTDTAIETADVALMDDDLRKIPLFIGLSRATHKLLVQNISLALGIKALFLGLTILGYGSMWMAVLADVGASLLVVANGLRLLRY